MSFLIGILAGSFGGLVGLGGGVVMVPLMVGLMRLRQSGAHGTSLVALVFTGLAGTATYMLHHSVDMAAAGLLALPAIFTAQSGARYCNSLPESKLRHAFGIFLILISLLMLAKPYVSGPLWVLNGWHKAAVLLATGLFTGFISGLMGIGGGAILIASMVLLAGMSQHTAQGSSLLAMVPAGVMGAYTHWELGNVEKGLLAGLIPGILLGTFLGGSLAQVFDEDSLRIIFAVVLICTGIRYLKTAPPTCEPEA
ncbi:MAG: sulfite exporter TauE/SafE family protein [Deltaproteobacteria bacterium]|nr:sulfite exporter TauE/SafE family protein [Deltaproteobacteria bacterium]